MTIDEATDEGKMIVKKIDWNKLAMHLFTLAFKTQRLMGMINKVKTDEWPGGRASDVTKLLLKRYKQDDAINIIDMTAELGKVKLFDKGDPAVLFEELYMIKNMYTSALNKVKDEQLIPYVLAGSPSRYHSIITNKVRTKGNALTLDDLEDVMNDQWYLTPEGKRSSANDDAEGEVSLVAFNGNCNHCGAFGHKAAQCPKKGNDNYNNSNNKFQSRNNNGNIRGKGNNQRSKKFNGNCNHCGKYGHKKIDCWELEENKSKRPTGWSSRMEQGAGAIEQSANNGAEFLLVSTNIILCSKCEEVTDNDKIAVTGMTMANKASILRDPNVWIADTGATSDSTFENSVMKGIEETKTNITMKRESLSVQARWEI